MSANLPEVLDAKRMIASRRIFEGTLPLASLERLSAFLDDPSGVCSYRLEFDTDALGIRYMEIRAEAVLQLKCQRTLERFGLPVQVTQRLGLVRDEADEAALPEGYEPLLVDAESMVRPAELIEDEFILAVPVIPVAPGTEAVALDVPPSADEKAAASPFAALSALKKHNS
ncbi:MAG: YceD family protein [Lysobacteraceae bacterium]